MSVFDGRKARACLVASLLVLGLPLAMSPAAISAPGATINPAESANYLRSTDGGDDFGRQSLDNVGQGVAQVTQVESEDGTVHALFSTNNDDDDFAFPFELYHRRSTNGGRDFEDGQRLDDDGGISSEPSMATTGDDVHVAYEENRLEFGLDANDDNVIDGDDVFPEEVFYTRSTDEGATFSDSINLSQTEFAQETDNDSAAVGNRVAVVYESNQIDPDDFDTPPAIPAEQETTARDIVIRVSNDRGETFEAPMNLTFDGTTDSPFESDDTSGQGQDQPKVGLSGDGEDDVVLVVFRVRPADGDDPTARVGYVRSTDGGETFGPIQLLPADADVDDLPALYMDGLDAHVLACDVTNRLLYWHSEDGGDTFAGPDVIHTGAERCAKPAIDGNGDELHVAFLEEVAGEPDVFHTSSDDGGDTWAGARNLTANHGGGEFPSIAVDTEDEDDVHIVWQDLSEFFFSVNRTERLPDEDGDRRSYANEDVIRYRGATYEMILDGSDVGLRNLRIDAMAVIEPAAPEEPERYLLSFTETGRIPGITGKVDDSDIVLFTPTSLGDDTAGTFELFFDGSEIGLTRSGEDIDAIELTDGDLYLSTYGDFLLDEELAGLGGKNEDVFVCRAATVASCEGGAEIVVDGSERELTRSSENVDAFAFDPADGNSPGSRAFFSTDGDFKTATAQGDDEDLFSCIFPEFDDNFPESETNFDGDVTDCGGTASPFRTTFVGEINRLDSDITSVEIRFPL